VAITASLDGDYLRLTDGAGDGLAVWRIADLRLVLDRGTRGVVLCAVGQPDARLTLGDPVVLAKLRVLSPGFGGSIRPKRQVGRGMLYGIGALFGLALLFAVILPRLAAAMATLVPRSYELRLGHDLLPVVAARFGGRYQEGDSGTCSGVDGQAAIDRLAARLSAARATRIPITVHVVDTRVVNAFALPGGQVVVLRGLLDFASGPTEFAGVLGHEMGHSQFAHPLQHVVEASFISLTIGLMMGDVLGVSAAGMVVQSLLTTAYSREAETAADRESLERLQAAGIGSVPFMEFTKRLTTGAAMPAILSTHPAPADRVRAMADHVRPGAQAMTPEEWESVRHICDKPKPAA